MVKKMMQLHAGNNINKRKALKIARQQIKLLGGLTLNLHSHIQSMHSRVVVKVVNQETKSFPESL